MANPSKDSFARRWSRRRAWIQAAFLLLWLDPFAIRMHTVCSPVFHCYSCPLAAFACPIGVIANFSALHLFPFVAVGTLVLIGASIGTAVCGWACPFGFLQDLIGRIPVPKVRLPAWTGLSRYAVLIAFVLVIPFLYGEEHALFFCRLCPAGALEGGLPSVVKAYQARVSAPGTKDAAANDDEGKDEGDEAADAKAALANAPIPWPSPTKLVILGLVLAAMFIKWRPWCSLFCPLGAIFGLFNRFSLVVLRFEGDNCRSCGACDKMCKYGVLPANSLNNSRCIRCLECTRCEAIKLSNAAQTSGLATCPRPERAPANTEAASSPG